MDTNTPETPITKAKLARLLNVSRTYVTLLTQGKKKPSKEMIDKLAKLGLTANLTNMYPHIYGSVAQLVEHQTFNLLVEGSIPSALSKSSKFVANYPLLGFFRQGYRPRRATAKTACKIIRGYPTGS